jgi:hypothetical protein
MAYTAVPDCHAAEEYGYWDSDGGYKQWQAWNRDLMLRLIPREFWYKLETRSKELPENTSPINRGIKSGALFSWRDVASDWHARLPELTDTDLQALTGVKDLSFETFQEDANSHVVYRLATSTKAESPQYEGPLPKSPIRLDNVLAVTRRTTPSLKDDLLGGYSTSPIESMMILRAGEGDRRDLIVIRADLAPYVLPMLRVKGRRASDSIIGFIHRQDPGEKQQLLLIAAQVDFGDKLPEDELGAIGK